MCIGKALTGGYLTLAATLCTEAVASAISQTGPIMHGPTFMANPLACAVALASTQLLLASNWKHNIATIHQGLTDGLRRASDLPQVRDVRTCGAIGVIELNHPVNMVKAQQVILAEKVWLRPFNNLIYTMPPYICSPQEIARITETMVHMADVV
jgi:adenosylmethionine-8-amino-7-oxononanoate aminotransferase